MALESQLTVAEDSAPEHNPRISLIIPCYNEEESIDELVAETTAVLDDNGLDGEIVIVDDGSRDRSWEKLSAHAEKEPRLKIVRFRRNFGQTAAMVAGIDFARGEILIPLDADLQNDPRSIPALLEKIEEGYDVVSGWRKNRKDAFLSRTLPSRIANGLISWVSGVHLHDYGCTLKAYRREVLDPVNLYGEMHRFIPVYASWSGAKVAEAVVNHRPRKYGESKYGIGRTFKVLLDLLVVKFLGSYGTKPIYFFGGLGFMLCSLGFASGAFALYLLGLLAEIGIRTYHESQSRSIYLIRDTANVTGPRRKPHSLIPQPATADPGRSPTSS
jgi:glycosyltransferase involved in cell wall biosynthesis